MVLKCACLYPWHLSLKRQNHFQDNGIKLKKKNEMTYNVGTELVLPAIRRRYSQSNRLKITVIKKYDLFLKSSRYRPTSNLKVSTEHLVDTSNRWKQLLVRNLARLKGRTRTIIWKKNVGNAKSLYLKITRQNCNLFVKIVLSNQTTL